MTPPSPRGALVASVEVPGTPGLAFALFTADLADWWPLVTHSVFELESVTVELEPRVGGRIVESSTDGDTSVWGTVRVWDPGYEVAFSWHPGGDLGTATDVSVRFEPVRGGTRVVLVHAGWQRRPDDAERARAAYDTGWRLVLERFARAAGA